MPDEIEEVKVKPIGSHNPAIGQTATPPAPAPAPAPAPQ